MKIKSLQISNILSFKFYENITEAPKIIFEDGVNILIGQNGAGKSTVLEVINLIFKQVLLTKFDLNQDLYDVRNTITDANQIKNIVIRNQNISYVGFRLEPNWNSVDSPQKIKIEIELDDIDRENLSTLEINKDKLNNIAQTYSNDSIISFVPKKMLLTLNLELNKSNNSLSATYDPDANDPGVLYLTKYNFYKEIIELHNKENPNDVISPLHESFALISSFRNYHTFADTVSLQQQSAIKQIQNIKINEHIKSTNGNEQSEPSIFSLVRLRIADKHFAIFRDVAFEKAEEMANNEEFLSKINNKLALVNLKIKIKLTDQRLWNYSFSFFDTKRNKILTNINSLSAGQKAIIHLIFEAYGRGDIKGGVVIIDEPEIHLHYQFQSEYLRIIDDINSEQNCQYILVTHSESLINSKTIHKVKRFFLDTDNYTNIKSPLIQDNQKTLIKILDNTRSTYAFFAKKIVLVEGDTDRYFFKTLFQILKPELNQEIAILDVGGKKNCEQWKNFFVSFGLNVYYIIDFDNVFTLKITNDQPLINKNDKIKVVNLLKNTKLDNLSQNDKNSFSEKYNKLITADKNKTECLLDRELWKPIIDQFIGFVKLKNQEIIEEIRKLHLDIDNKIEDLYSQNIYILKSGSLEEYTKTSHGDLNQIINFCENELTNWLQLDNIQVQEIKAIVEKISND